MSVLFRYISLLFVLLAALAAPAAGYFAFSAYGAWQEAADSLDKARQVKLAEQGAQGRMAAFEEYAAEAGRFLAAAQSAGVVDDAWIRYTVDVKERIVDLNQLYNTLENARNGLGFYFRPTLLELSSLKGEGLPQEIKNQIRKDKISPESHILATIQGDYLVFNRR